MIRIAETMASRKSDPLYLAVTVSTVLLSFTAFVFLFFCVLAIKYVNELFAGVVNCCRFSNHFAGINIQAAVGKFMPLPSLYLIHIIFVHRWHFNFFTTLI